MNFDIPSPKTLRDNNEGIIGARVAALINQIVRYMKNNSSSHKGFNYSITAEDSQIAERVCEIFNRSQKWKAIYGNSGFKGEYYITFTPLE